MTVCFSEFRTLVLDFVDFDF